MFRCASCIRSIVVWQKERKQTTKNRLTNGSEATNLTDEEGRQRQETGDESECSNQRYARDAENQKRETR